LKFFILLFHSSSLLSPDLITAFNSSDSCAQAVPCICNRIKRKDIKFLTLCCFGLVAGMRTKIHINIHYMYNLLFLRLTLCQAEPTNPYHLSNWSLRKKKPLALKKPTTPTIQCGRITHSMAKTPTHAKIAIASFIQSFFDLGCFRNVTKSLAASSNLQYAYCFLLDTRQTTNSKG
jgi:hypothetical protein